MTFQQCAVCCRDEASQVGMVGGLVQGLKQLSNSMERESVWKTSKKRQELDRTRQDRQDEKRGGKF